MLSKPRPNMKKHDFSMGSKAKAVQGEAWHDMARLYALIPCRNFITHSTPRGCGFLNNDHQRCPKKKPWYKL